MMTNEVMTVSNNVVAPKLLNNEGVKVPQPLPHNLDIEKN